MLDETIFVHLLKQLSIKDLKEYFRNNQNMMIPLSRIKSQHYQHSVVFKDLLFYVIHKSIMIYIRKYGYKKDEKNYNLEIADIKNITLEEGKYFDSIKNILQTFKEYNKKSNGKLFGECKNNLGHKINITINY